jgi:antitoxin ParD1/3/4
VPTRNVDLTQHFDDFISAAIDAGRYSDASEAVRAGLTSWSSKKRKIRRSWNGLRAITKEAFDALDLGEGIPFHRVDDLDAFVNEAVAEARAVRIASHA